MFKKTTSSPSPTQIGVSEYSEGLTRPSLPLIDWYLLPLLVGLVRFREEESDWLRCGSECQGDLIRPGYAFASETPIWKFYFSLKSEFFTITSASFWILFKVRILTLNLEINWNTSITFFTFDPNHPPYVSNQNQQAYCSFFSIYRL